MLQQLDSMSIDQKRELVKKLLIEEQSAPQSISLADFAGSSGRIHEEINQFSSFKTGMIGSGNYPMEIMRMEAPNPSVGIRRQTGDEFSVLNFANYNYLGLATHPDVIDAAKGALDTYGLGATASPLAGGLLDIHKELEDTLLEFFGLEGYGITLFTSGFGALVGIITAYIHEGDHIVLDSAAHACIVDGVIASRGTAHYFMHNDMEELEDILEQLDDGESRILICTEGVYSVDGDYGDIRSVAKLAKKYGATTLVDEAHSMLLAGEQGRGACEELGVFGDIDMIAGTFSKSFAGVGGFLFAKKEFTDYVNYFARNRMFSCALDPAVTAGMTASLRLAMGPEGEARRKRLRQNSKLFRSLLEGKVNLGESETWVIPVIYGAENISLSLTAYLQKEGLEGSMMVYPAVPKNRARIRIFMSSEHTEEQIKKATGIILKAAKEFDFLIG
ncbi:MAG: pyridoxal phosphate-dependent aminotransferase family protein [bacterium]|nr:pyridoxal phosphate-dependent aminotransferase family protein [bacterium]